MIHNFNNYYIPKDKRKKILLIGDDIRFNSGCATVMREIVIGTSMHYNWVQLAGTIKHPDKGKRLDLNDDTNKLVGINDSSIILYPTDGYGTQEMVRQLIEHEKPDVLMMMTDPRYFYFLFQMEHEIRQKIPMIYLNIWDDLPYPMYNKSFYESCDTLFAISKQTENINKQVLGKELASEKLIKYIPHGINEDMFFPITQQHPEYLALQEFKSQIFKNKEYDFVLMYNARNIRRKCVSDLMLSYKIFIDQLPEEKAKKCALLLHTQIADENGTDLQAVKQMLFGNIDKYNIIFSENRLPTQQINLLYNLSDAVTLVSSNEGWGLSLTEAMMCGKPIIANVTGGMQDQMRFEDENGKWIEFTEEFGSNHRGKYKKCGKWAFPVFPTNISLIGSIPTPYIYDDKVSPEDVAKQIRKVYDLKMLNPEEYKDICNEARKWVTSDESMMSARLMSKNVIDGIDETLQNWSPRYKFELIKMQTEKQPKHYIKYPIAI